MRSMLAFGDSNSLKGSWCNICGKEKLWIFGGICGGSRGIGPIGFLGV